MKITIRKLAAKSLKTNGFFYAQFKEENEMEEFMADNAAEITADSSAAATETGNFENTVSENAISESENIPSNEIEATSEETQSPMGAANTENNVETDEYKISKTKAFSDRLNKMSQKRVDDMIAKFGWNNPYTGQPIKTQSQLDEYNQMKEAAERGKDPLAASEINNLKRRISSYEKREQDFALMNNPDTKNIYKEIRNDVIGLVEYCEANGISNVDINAAYSTILSRNFKQIMEKVQKNTEKQTINKISSTNNAAVGSLGDSADNTAKSIDEMSSEEFSRLKAKVLRGEKVSF